MPIYGTCHLAEYKTLRRVDAAKKERTESMASLLDSEQTSILLDDVARGVPTALDQLSHDQKSALLLYAEGYKYHEIASRLSKPINTIRTLIRRARLSVTSKRT